MTQSYEIDINDSMDLETIEAIEKTEHVKNPTIEDVRRIFSGHSALVFKWGDTETLVDALTANALLTVYNALNPDMQAKFNRMIGANYNQFIKIVNFTWSQIQ
jgi:hypothetical protein